MEKKNKILLLILVCAFLLVVLAGYYNFFILGNYEVTKQVPCDPKTESCFVSDCESNDSSCDQTTTYKKISVLSKYAGSDYDSLTCTENSNICKIITCQDDTIEAGEKCFK
jgi:capsular polysaccharide biosynthesis protein